MPPSTKYSLAGDSEKCSYKLLIDRFNNGHLPVMIYCTTVNYDETAMTTGFGEMLGWPGHDNSANVSVRVSQDTYLKYNAKNFHVDGFSSEDLLAIAMTIQHGWGYSGSAVIQKLRPASELSMASARLYVPDNRNDLPGIKGAYAKKIRNSVVIKGWNMENKNNIRFYKKLDYIQEDNLKYWYKGCFNSVMKELLTRDVKDLLKLIAQSREIKRLKSQLANLDSVKRIAAKVDETDIQRRDMLINHLTKRCAYHKQDVDNMKVELKSATDRLNHIDRTIAQTRLIGLI